MHPLTERYNKISVKTLQDKKQYGSKYEIPHIDKCVINAGIGDLKENGGLITDFSKTLSLLTGQKPVVNKARKAISGFKIREGNPIGLKITLRGDKMNDFILKLIDFAILRTRDFRGLKKSCVSANGNLSIGIKDISIFPDLPLEVATHSFQIVISSTAKTLEEAMDLYTSLGFVFQADENNKSSK